MFIGGSQQSVGLYLEVIIQQDGTVFYIIDVRAYLIHTVSRFNRHYIVNARITEDAVRQVDSLVTAVAQEDILRSHTLHLAQSHFHILLQRVGITVVRSIVRILIGIQEDL